MMIRWRARSVGRRGRNFPRLFDSAADDGALSKRRSSGGQLHKVVRSFSSWEPATSARAVLGFASSAQNPAGTPPRLEGRWRVRPIRPARRQSGPGKVERRLMNRRQDAGRGTLEQPSSLSTAVPPLSFNLPLPATRNDVDFVVVAAAVVVVGVAVVAQFCYCFTEDEGARHAPTAASAAADF
ncbi:unnamed protein product [Prorocentrum cordatum]|uniref:Uncharacterized protein n=1 Tax=Prorocentrum cordatum TaxID=2364126 RepID=A0ABN9UKP2_9DINO|nr:unnamed protein product [Polarella glacialis]